MGTKNTKAALQASSAGEAAITAPGTRRYRNLDVYEKRNKILEI